MLKVFSTELANPQVSSAFEPLRGKMRDIMINDLANEVLLEVTMTQI